MKAAPVVMFMATLVAVACFVGMAGPAATAGAVPIVPLLSSVPALNGADFAYVGSNACKKCHLGIHKSWAANPHGSAMKTLMPGEKADVKKQFNLDPAKDYTTDAKCLKCHSTGFGQTGGYAVPDPADAKAVKAAEKLANVGCENCHGPGAKYNEVFEEITKSARKYKVDELYAAGLRKVDASTCTTCHNAEGPTHDPKKPFDFEASKAKLHERQELKQREQ